MTLIMPEKIAAAAAGNLVVTSCYHSALSVGHRPHRGLGLHLGDKAAVHYNSLWKPIHSQTSSRYLLLKVSSLKQWYQLIWGPCIFSWKNLLNFVSSIYLFIYIYILKCLQSGDWFSNFQLSKCLLFFLLLLLFGLAELACYVNKVLNCLHFHK